VDPAIQHHQVTALARSGGFSVYCPAYPWAPERQSTFPTLRGHTNLKISRSASTSALIWFARAEVGPGESRTNLLCSVWRECGWHPCNIIGSPSGKPSCNGEILIPPQKSVQADQRRRLDLGIPNHLECHLLVRHPGPTKLAKPRLLSLGP
jgi:hypothetical protein